MTCYIDEESQSSLKDGIETIVIPIHDHHDMEQLVFHTQRGGVYSVVEWLLSELYRSTELERVAGLTVTPNDSQVVVNLELKQPGRQIEEWLMAGNPLRLEYPTLGEGARAYEVLPNGEEELLGYLSTRSLSLGKFTDQHRPWWEGQEIQEVSTG